MRSITLKPETRDDIDVHLISDSTGETLSMVATAALAQFHGAVAHRHLHVFMRNEAELNAALSEVEKIGGLVFFTLMNPALREILEARCERAGIDAIAPLDALTNPLSQYLGREISHQLGAQYTVDSQYFDRIAALDYAIAHDDGLSADRLRRADLILVGVSRTSKTPTCIYLAYRGVKAANVPLVPGIEPPEALLDAARSGKTVIGLTASPTRLSHVRQHRLETLEQSSHGDYADIKQVRREVADARLLFEKMDWPVIDVTRRSIEETAAAVLVILRKSGAEE